MGYSLLGENFPRLSRSSWVTRPVCNGEGGEPPILQGVGSVLRAR